MIVSHPTRSTEGTRERILAAAREILAKKGRRGTTTREVAEAAGVNEATLFRHFGTKQALLDATAQHYCRAVELQALLENLTGDLRSDLLRIASFMYDALSNVRDLIIVSLAEEEQETAVGTAAWRAPSAIHGAIADFMARRVAGGELAGNPVLLTRVFVGMIFARVIGRNKFPDGPGGPHEYLTFLVDVLLDGVRKK